MGRRALLCCVALMVGATFGLTGCGGRGVVAGERFVQGLSRELAATNHAFNESAVASKLDEMFSGLGSLSEEQRKDLYEAGCTAKNMYDLSKVSSYNEAVKWVAGQSKVPAAKAKMWLNDLRDLQKNPTLIGSGELTASTLCSVA
ncbi:MAG: hypothetical protein QOH60_5245 [Mycobacterium sp.]|jgi:hypothetical protein|nr:hypothetical protein [Mycobacterium sp.]